MHPEGAGRPIDLGAGRLGDAQLEKATPAFERASRMVTT